MQWYLGVLSTDMSYSTEFSSIFTFGDGPAMDYYIVGLHTAVIPPKIPTRNSKTRLQPYDMYYPSYVYDNHVYTAFLPEPLDVSDGILHCLRYTWSNFPIETVDGCRFRLNTKVVDQWNSLAAVVRALKALLVEIVGQIPAAFPLNIREPAPPTAYQYDKVCNSDSKLRRNVLAAKAAFYYNLAFISYMAALCSMETDLTQECPGWATEALRRELLGHSMFNSLKDTWVFNLQARRKGAFVNAQLGMRLNKSFDSTQWFKDIPRFLKVVPNMPFWLRYARGPVPSDDRYALARRYLPTDDRVLEAWKGRLASRVEGETKVVEAPKIIITPSTACVTDKVANAPNFDPAPCAKRPHMRGAAFPAFVQALDAYIRESLKLENPVTKALMERRLLEQQDQPCPSKGVPTVWRWVLEYDNSWSSYAVSKYHNSVKELWDETRWYQRYYDPYKNAYHVSIYAEPGDVPGTEGVQPFPPNPGYDLEEDEDDASFKDDRMGRYIFTKDDLAFITHSS